VRRYALIARSLLERGRFAWLRARHRGQLLVGAGVSPAFGRTHLRIEPGGRLVLEDGCATEPQPGNRIWVHADGLVVIGAGTWMRTEYGTNYVTAFAGAELRIGPRAFVNGCMFHAKSRIQVGADCLFGFGARIVDADLHALDVETPERIDPIEIGDRVWIGADATVMRGVTIGDDTVVGARSVVTRSLPARVLALGAPARPVREIGRRG
jgi:maltose O-acetyltransferase